MYTEMTAATKRQKQAQVLYTHGKRVDSSVEKDRQAQNKNWHTHHLEVGVAAFGIRWYIQGHRVVAGIKQSPVALITLIFLLLLLCPATAGARAGWRGRVAEEHQHGAKVGTLSRRTRSDAGTVGRGARKESWTGGAAGSGAKKAGGLERARRRGGAEEEEEDYLVR